MTQQGTQQTILAGSEEFIQQVSKHVLLEPHQLFIDTKREQGQIRKVDDGRVEELCNKLLTNPPLLAASAKPKR
jgi:hypothetical protein